MDLKRQIELKLSIDPGDAPSVLDHPILRGTAIGDPEVQHLHCVYYDSRDLALLGQGIRLRLLRTGGRQWQRVMLGDQNVAGLCARAEIEVELPGEQRPELAAIPDEGVRERVIEVLGGQRLEPVFETAIERTCQRFADDGCGWSLALDRGEVRAGFAREPVCELELALERGSASQLFEIALRLSDSIPFWPGTRSTADHGYSLRTGERAVGVRARLLVQAREATLREVIISIARWCLVQIGDHADLAFEGTDPEGVHRMRVGVRRMRALIALSRRAIPSARLGRLRGPLRWLSGLLGEVRDLDVLLDERIDPLVASGSHEGAFLALREETVALREERRLVLREALRSRRYAQLMLELGHWVASLEEMELVGSQSIRGLARPAIGFAESALARLERKARSRAPSALAGAPAARHDLRISLEKLRYASEFFRCLYGTKDAKRYLRRLSRLQDLLGVQNDIATAARLLQDVLDHCPPERAAELARAAGFIEGVAVRNQAETMGELSERWLRFAAARGFWTPQ